MYSKIHLVFHIHGTLFSHTLRKDNIKSCKIQTCTFSVCTDVCYLSMGSVPSTLIMLTRPDDTLDMKDLGEGTEGKNGEGRRR